MASGHVQHAIDGAILAIKSLKANPNSASFPCRSPWSPWQAAPPCGIDADKRLRDIMGIWADDNRAVGQTRDWVLEGFKAAGVTREDVPAEVSF